MSACRHHTNVCTPKILVAALPAITESTTSSYFTKKYDMFYNETKVRLLIYNFRENNHLPVLWSELFNVWIIYVKNILLFYIFTPFKYRNWSYIFSTVSRIFHPGPETPITGRTRPAAYTSQKLGPNSGIAPTLFYGNTWTIRPKTVILGFLKRFSRSRNTMKLVATRIKKI